jgi:hypothetical protein
LKEKQRKKPILIIIPEPIENNIIVINTTRDTSFQPDFIPVDPGDNKGKEIRVVLGLQDLLRGSTTLILLLKKPALIRNKT